MEIQRPRNPSEELDHRVPSAPDFDQESLSNAVDNELPELVERHQLRPSIWARMRGAFSRYKRMKEEEVSPIANEQPPAYSVSNTARRSDDPNDGSLLSADLARRNSLLRKVYWLFCGQMSLFTGLCALFYYVPHVRQIFRKTFADKILFKSMLGMPLGIAVLVPILFQPIRRRYAKLWSILLTTCLSCLLCYAMSYQADNLLFLMEMALTDGCFLSAGLLNLIVPKFSQRHKLESLFFPLVMIAGQTLQPLLLHQHLSKTWYKNLIFVLGGSYLGYNVNSVMNSRELALKPNEAPLALFQSYFNFNPSGLATRLFRRSPRSNFQRI